MSSDSRVISETIRVYLRQRPQTAFERENPEDHSGSQSGGSKLSLEPNGRCLYEPAARSGCNDKFPQEYKYNFNACYGHGSSQKDLYIGSAQDIIQSSLKGYSGTIFAYGPTNSGKTYTMRGGGVGVSGQQGDFSKGLMERAVEEVLDGLSSTGGELWASYLQIYCEVVSDLLQDVSKMSDYTPPATAVGGGGKAAIAALKDTPRNDSAQAELLLREKDGKVFIEGAQRRQIRSVKEFAALLEEGDDNRATAETNLNEASSRSHTVCMLRVMVPEDTEQKEDTKDDGPRSFKESTVLMVDLAGCERAEASVGKHYKRSEEARAINLSLTSLGNCMNALAEKRKFIPYRDSKLTRLLQGCLGAGSRTSVVVTLPPGSAPNFDQSALPVLRFAARAMKVTVSAKVNRFVDYKALYDNALKALADKEASEKTKKEEERSNLLEQYESELAKAKEEIVILRRQLLTYKGNATSLALASITTPGEEEDGNVFVTGGGSGGGSGNEYWQAQIESLTQTHLKETAAAREERDRKIRILTRTIEESNEDNDQLRKALKRERECHLETAQKMRAYQQNNHEMEEGHQTRLSELLIEITEYREQLESQADALELYREQNKRMERLLQEEVSDENEDNNGSVPKAKFDELQSMFAETVEKLTTRLLKLEESRSEGAAPASAGSSSRGGGGLGQQTNQVPQRGSRYAPSGGGAASRRGGFGGSGRGGGFGVGGTGLGRR